MSLRSSARKVSARKKAFDAFVKTLAWYVGWVGMILLAACGVLWLAPGALGGVTAERLPMYTMGAILMASFVGWLYVNKGQDRIKKHLGRAVNIVLFLLIPTACMIAGFAQDPIVDATGWQPPAHPFWLVVHWYPIALVIVCAAVFLGWKSKPRKHVYLDRGAGYALLFAPYALLFVYLSLGVHLDWVEASMRETLTAMGQYAIAIQLIMTFFIGGE
jgi:hypothetical protein